MTLHKIQKGAKSTHPTVQYNVHTMLVVKYTHTPHNKLLNTADRVQLPRQIMVLIWIVKLLNHKMSQTQRVQSLKWAISKIMKMGRGEWVCSVKSKKEIGLLCKYLHRVPLKMRSVYFELVNLFLKLYTYTEL